MSAAVKTLSPLHTSAHNRLASTVKSTVPSNLTKQERTRWMWRHADGVCFDVDSTVCRDEAIDELASYLDCGEEVAQFTRKAMNGCGNMTFRDALAARLQIMKPTKDQFDTYVRSHEPKLTQGIKELIRELKRRGVAVYLVSGGFRRIIMSAARCLNIPRDHIYANELHFDANGNYSGFDTNELTSDSGSPNVGKPAVCRLLKQRYHHKHLVMVGDGATDMEAAPPADAFIGFGGNQVRENVRREAHWFVYSFDELLTELNINNQA